MGILKFLKGKNDQEISFIKENVLEDWWEQSFSDREKNGSWQKLKSEIN